MAHVEIQQTGMMQQQSEGDWQTQDEEPLLCVHTDRREEAKQNTMHTGQTGKMKQETERTQDDGGNKHWDETDSIKRTHGGDRHKTRKTKTLKMKTRATERVRDRKGETQNKLNILSKLLITRKIHQEM